MTLCYACGHATQHHLAKGMWRRKGAHISWATACLECPETSQVCQLSASEAAKVLERVR